MFGHAARHRISKRASALGAALAVTATLIAPAAATAAPPKPAPAKPAQPTYLPGSLLADALASPFKKFSVIVELKKGGNQGDVAGQVRGLGLLRHRFHAIDGVSAQLPGIAIIALSKRTDLLAITRDTPVHLTDYAPAQSWPLSIGADALWAKDAVTCATDPNTGFQLDPACAPAPAILPPTPPAIAVVDSGIDASRVGDFGSRVIASVGLSSLAPGATADDYGHGTFVASIAAGQAADHPGVAPGAPIVNVRVMDNQGMAMTSDVIAAADWILQNKSQYGIGVANFSLHASTPNSFKFDPLDHAVERLWFAGVTVVAAAGNFGTGSPLAMVYAPANDPFVITVGAADTQGTVDPADDSVAPWSAFGYTPDGFAKPELVAPGRYLIGAVPDTAVLAAERPDHVVAPGYMQLSGTSFSAPAVAGAAAQLLAAHPGWSPDQVKGALMATANALAPAGQPLASGVGEIDVAAAAQLASPPNPNAGLAPFVVSDPTVPGGLTFNAVSWSSAAGSDVSWDSVSWGDVSWGSVSWGDVSWSSVSWSSVSWGDASQADAALSDVSWSDVSWAE